MVTTAGRPGQRYSETSSQGSKGAIILGGGPAWEKEAARVKEIFTSGGGGGGSGGEAPAPVSEQIKKAFQEVAKSSKGKTSSQLTQEYARKIRVIREGAGYGGSKVQRLLAGVPKLTIYPKTIYRTQTRLQNIQRTPAYKTTIRALDFISGGRVTERNFRLQQESINKKIESFNRRYGDKTLQEKEYLRALSEERAIEKAEQSLKGSKEKFEKSPTKIINRLIFGNWLEQKSLR